MFEYAEKDLEKKIEDLETKYQSKKEEEYSYSKSIEDIESYFDYRKSRINYIIFMILLFIIATLLPCGIMPGTFDNVGSIVVMILTTIVSYSESGMCLKKFFNISKKLKKDYSNFLDLSKEELLKTKELFSEKEYSAYSQGIEIYNQLEICKSKLNQIEHYRSVLETVKDPYYVADSKEQYQELMIKQQAFMYNDEKQECLCLFDNYLSEKVDYSNIHFDDDIDHTIDYREDVKRKVMMK